MAKIKVGVVVLNFNGRSDTLDCLASLEKLTNKEADPTVFVVDNNSHDKSVEEIREKFPKIEVIANSVNLGFSGGNNVGIKKALQTKADFILLLNNDTIVEPNFLDELVKFGRSHPRVGILGPTLKFKRGFEVFYDLGGKINPWFGRTTHKTVSLLADQLPSKVDYLSGACLLIRSAVINKIGMLEEDYFFGFEDVEFCLEARKNGFEIYNVPTSIVEHKISGSVGQTSPLKIYYLLRNNLRFFYRNLILPRNLFGYFYLVVLSAKIVFNSPRYIVPISQAWADFVRGRFGKKREKANY